jgi:hypothetical protein
MMSQGQMQQAQQHHVPAPAPPQRTRQSSRKTKKRVVYDEPSSDEEEELVSSTYFWKICCNVSVIDIIFAIRIYHLKSQKTKSVILMMMTLRRLSRPRRLRKTPLLRLRRILKI